MESRLCGFIGTVISLFLRKACASIWGGRRCTGIRGRLIIGKIWAWSRIGPLLIGNSLLDPVTTILPCDKYETCGWSCPVQSRTLTCSRPRSLLTLIRWLAKRWVALVRTYAFTRSFDFVSSDSFGRAAWTASPPLLKVACFLPAVARWMSLPRVGRSTTCSHRLFLSSAEPGGAYALDEPESPREDAPSIPEEHESTVNTITCVSGLWWWEISDTVDYEECLNRKKMVLILLGEWRLQRIFFVFEDTHSDGCFEGR